MDAVKARPKTAQDVLREQLELAHDIAPGYVMPGSVVSALEEAGFSIMSHDDIQNEVADAFQAGVDSVSA